MYDRRMQLIERISKLRKTKVICYVGGDRKSVSIRIAPDIIPVFYEQLQNIGNSEKIDLFLFTKGGDVLTALRLVQLMYEYTDNFSVIIPYKAYSAGTLISLGAKDIVMGKMSELSPVDPDVTSIYNPKDNNNPNANLPINVEDVYSYFTVAKDIVGIKSDDALAEIFNGLIEYVHPLAIGSIQRTHSLIRLIAKKLLLTHIDASEEFRIKQIVDNLTEKLYSHSYMITRKEAKETIKLPVVYADGELEKSIWQLYKEYEKDLLLNIPFIPENNSDINGNFRVGTGFIETKNKTYEYIFEGMIRRRNAVEPNFPNEVSIIKQGWEGI